jgi:hypothetical protein
VDRDVGTAGGPDDIVLKGRNTIIIKNVLVGDVWLASGQSNMEFPMLGAGHFGGVAGAEHEIDAARFPGRLRRHARRASLSGKFLRLFAVGDRSMQWLRATGYGLRATGYGLRATGYGLRATDVLHAACNEFDVNCLLVPRIAVQVGSFLEPRFVQRVSR